MVTVATFLVPSEAPPPGLSSMTSNVSFVSSNESLFSPMTIVWLVTPAGKVSMPPSGVKSVSLSALPSMVMKSTVTSPALPPVRLTVRVTVGEASPITELATLNCRRPAVPGVSLSVMIISALLRLPMDAPPSGFESVRRTVSLVSKISSSRMSKVKVTFVSPSAKASVPSVGT